MPPERHPHMNLPKIIFAGTPDFSVSCLSTLLERDVDVVGVYTQPDRVAGRGKKIQQSPVKQRALQAGIEVFQPENFKQADSRNVLAALQPDLMVVVAYGLILPQSILDIPRLGCVNIHASLLPRWRGAAPIQRAIEAGDTQTGVCLMQMEKGLDTGPVLARETHDIAVDETGGELHDALSEIGARLLGENLGALLNGEIRSREQADTGLTYAHKLNKAETRIDWQQSAQHIRNKIRAFNPWPVMATQLDDQIIRIHRAELVSGNPTAVAQPGVIKQISPAGIEVQTGEGCLRILELQKPGGRVMPTRDFLNGFKLHTGQRFD